MHKHTLKWLLPAAWLLSLSAAAAEPDPKVVIGERFTVQSKVLGEAREYWVYLPRSYATTAQHYPVIYLLDGDAHFHHATGLVDFLSIAGRMPQAIVVAILNTDRTRDLTPPYRSTSTTEYLGQQRRIAEAFPTAGGAGRFLEFIAGELAPKIESTYRTSPYRVLIGHSFGGTFALHALQTRPEAFHAYIAVSPAAGWDERELIKKVAELPKTLPPGGRTLYLSMGDEEGPFVAPFQELITALQRAKTPRLTWRHALMKGEDHGSTPHETMMEGLKLAFDGWRVPPQLLRAADLIGVEAHFAKLSGRMGYEVPPPELLINNLGYALLQQGKVDAAIAAFRRNVARYPGSPNVHDSLGEGLETAGKLEEALKSYERAVQLGALAKDPNLDAYRAHADKLRAARGRELAPAERSGEPRTTNEPRGDERG